MVDVKGELRRIVHDKEMGSTQIAIAVLKRLAEIGKGKERREVEALIATALEIATERASMPVIRNSLRELQSFVADVVDLERAVEGVIEGIVERTAASVSRLVGHLGKGISVL
jgi:translation initiation factor 2B subunit (eIF-2B alpha/beta/delta family)